MNLHTWYDDGTEEICVVCGEIRNRQTELDICPGNNETLTNEEK
jgi:hypothetical protein